MHRTLTLTVLAMSLVVSCSSAPTSTPTSPPRATPISPQTLAPTQPAAPTPSSAPTPSTAPLGVREISSADFTNVGGCGDVFMWAATDDDSMAITVQWDGAARAAWEEGAFGETVELPQDGIQVSLVAGSGLSSLYCNDVLMPGVEENSNVRASAGSVELTVRPDEGGFEPASHADVTLRDLMFDVISGTDEETWHLEELVIENVSVGWFAG